jgi:DNA polymerase-3 subunit alpha
VCVVYHNPGATCEIELGPDWRVSPSDDLLQSLAGWLTADNVSVLYS